MQQLVDYKTFNQSIYIYLLAIIQDLNLRMYQRFSIPQLFTEYFNPNIVKSITDQLPPTAYTISFIIINSVINLFTNIQF